MRSLAAGVALVLGLLTGCKDNLPKATEIVHMRVLGSKFEVVGDESRSTPKPGEQVRVSLSTVFPKLDRKTSDTQSMLIGCTAPTRFTGGIPLCQEFLDAAIQGRGADIKAVLDLVSGKVRCQDLPDAKQEYGGVSIECVTGAPQLQLSIAAGFTASQKLLLGVVCERGEAYIAPAESGLFGCDHNDGETLRVHALIPVQHRDRDQNHNPSAAELQLKLRSSSDINDLKNSDTSSDISLTPFEESTAPPEEGCSAAASTNALPIVDFVSRLMTLFYPASARETVNGQPEDLELSTFTTLGKLERRFTLFGASSKPDKDGMLEGTLKWTPAPKEDIPADGKLVRFFVTLRDQRGGFDQAEFGACVRGIKR